jgi:small multidrug resistance family-3 protein
MHQALFLVAAALLEVGGDALTRWSLRGHRWIGFLPAAALLFAYGLTVNLPPWNFGRLMGVYIAVFFVVSQAVAVLVFHERLPAPTWVGGILIVAGGLVMSAWKPT